MWGTDAFTAIVAAVLVDIVLDRIKPRFHKFGNLDCPIAIVRGVADLGLLLMAVSPEGFALPTRPYTFRTTYQPAVLRRSRF